MSKARKSRDYHPSWDWSLFWPSFAYAAGLVFMALLALHFLVPALD